jgi:Cu(I)/Ag(I) efflux system protein CusF
MKILIAAAALLAATPALAQHAESHASPPAAAAAPATADAAKTGQGVGVVKAVDAKAGKVTLHHGPVAALGWPAMTMTFKAAPQILQGVKSGQKVSFTAADADEPEITAITPQ